MARRPFRRTLILTCAALGTVLAAAGGWRYARASAPLSGPIIIVSIDTLRADHLPAYGYRKIKTPAFDLLASDGVVFERAYSHAPETLPAHTALLAGRLPFETGVRADGGPALKPGERLLPGLLRDRGYATAAVVSTSLLAKSTGISRGFDFFDDAMPPNPEEPAVQAGRRDGGDSEKIAEHWLDGAGTSRAFLFLHLDEPHAPWTPPERYAQYAPYDAEIAYADEIVGRLIHYLKTHQMYDRSTIVLLSDHGEGLGDHGEEGHGLFLYDEAIRVPLIVKQESNAGSGRRVADLVQHIDIVPTILDLVKAPIPANLHGRSLKPLLDNSGRVREQPVYSEALYGHDHFGWSALTALTDGSYEYISAPREELYDLARDPGERDNLAEPGATPDPQSRRELAALKGSLTRMTAGVPAAAEAGEPPADPKDKVEVLDRYRTALDLVAARRWSDALPLLQGVARDEPQAPEIWNELAGIARLLSRYDVALDAYRHVIDLEPARPQAYLDTADTLFKERRLEDARARAAEAASVAADTDGRSRAAAHMLLARIALARREPETARDEADLAHQADPAVPMPAFVEGRILYDEGKYDEALPKLQEALTTTKADADPIPDLHFYIADTLARLDQGEQAEAEFAEELRRDPQNVRARAGLASAYHAGGDADAADTAISDMLRAVPTPESYSTAARLFTSFGRTREADATRAEARRRFTTPHR
jgi:arylsulfatase A-like enzyme/cytochrome c-type biogenesis protein CcmH/NrfG